MSKTNKKQSKSARRRPVRKIDWDKYAHLLGTMPDSHVAKKIPGKPVPQAVLYARRARNIPAFKDAGAPPKQAPARSQPSKGEPLPKLVRAAGVVFSAMETIAAMYAVPNARKGGK